MMLLKLRAFAPTGSMAVDADGYEVPGYADMGWCAGKIQGGTAQGKDTQTRYLDIGGVSRPVLEGGLHIPVGEFITSADGLLIKAGEQRGLGWEFVVEGVNGLADCALLRRRYLVVEVPAKSYATARRLSVVEV